MKYIENTANGKNIPTKKTTHAIKASFIFYFESRKKNASAIHINQNAIKLNFISVTNPAFKPVKKISLY